LSLYLLHRASYNNLFILSNLDTHIQYSVVLLDCVKFIVSPFPVPLSHAFEGSGFCLC